MTRSQGTGWWSDPQGKGKCWRRCAKVRKRQRAEANRTQSRPPERGACHSWSRSPLMRSEFWVLGVSSTVTSTDPGGSRELLDCECRSWLERRGKELLELDVEVSRLENANVERIEAIKGRQEAAV
ncbi:hypothetical protein F5Y02DRAFT_355245 [Annulohypoxylon stygium]|nr:hypothetical protein F5Y02DRAFT_355245 [Annulohypoxylon stygium]